MKHGEVTAGAYRDKGENPKDAAFRELREETGYWLDDIIEIDGLEEGIYASPVYNWAITLFLWKA